MQWRLVPRNKPGLLWAVLGQFKSSNAKLSLEGDLEAFGVLDHPLASLGETKILKRQTKSPRMEFVVLPLSETLITQLKKQLGGAGVFSKDGGLIHVQIEAAGSLVFGAYDNFHEDCTFVGGVPESFVQTLIGAAILRSYEAA